MSDKNTGGPAFPLVGHFYGDKLGGQLDHGMTLRDYFAAKAMQSFLCSRVAEIWSNERLSGEAYDMADAMLKARES